jgi:hypothetical protein
VQVRTHTFIVHCRMDCGADGVVDCGLSHAPPLRSPYAALQPSSALPGPEHTLVPVGRQFQKKSQFSLEQTAWREQSTREDNEG